MNSAAIETTFAIISNELAVARYLAAVNRWLDLYDRARRETRFLASGYHEWVTPSAMRYYYDSSAISSLKKHSRITQLARGCTYLSASDFELIDWLARETRRMLSVRRRCIAAFQAI